MLSTVSTAAPAAGPKNAPVPPITAAISTVAERAIDTLSAPLLSSDQANVVRLTPLSQPNPNVPPRAPLGWGQRLMGLD
ncbi:hypothetical protein, partial [Burkholderia sp. Ac-20345]|uniref:hypothetical protein n=1 Tax=Burkholderia sp. Ac-20345 TaxID=2703891 RepID=UPI00197C4555